MSELTAQRSTCYRLLECGDIVHLLRKAKLGFLQGAPGRKNSHRPPLPWPWLFTIGWVIYCSPAESGVPGTRSAVPKPQMRM